MPVVNADQARIELTREQFLNIVEYINRKCPMREQVPHTIAIEETNLGKTVVVVGMTRLKDHEMTFLVFSGGEVQEFKEH